MRIFSDWKFQIGFRSNPKFLGQNIFFSLDFTVFVTPFSFGFIIGEWQPHHPKSTAFDWETVISIADIMMNKAKNSGINAWRGIITTKNGKPENLCQRIQQNLDEILQNGEIVMRSSL